MNLYSRTRHQTIRAYSYKGEEFQLSLSIRSIFAPDYEHYEGVRRINIYLLRLMFVLMFLLLGRDAWTYILTHEGPWNPDEAVAWSVFASFSVLALLGIIRPLKMLPLVFLEIAYKVLWLSLVAYPLWSTGELAGSPAEERTFAFLFVALPIIAMPWKYAFDHYVRGRQHGAPEPEKKLDSAEREAAAI
jgi:hypothetical protein